MGLPASHQPLFTGFDESTVIENIFSIVGRPDGNKWEGLFQSLSPPKPGKSYGATAAFSVKFRHGLPRGLGSLVLDLLQLHAGERPSAGEMLAELFRLGRRS
jgi:hypothetical protein